MELENQINKLYKEENWSDCEKHLKKALAIEPENFWYWTTLSSAVYEQKKYEEAKEYSEKAFKLNSESPLVWWDYASVLYMLGEDERAIQFWEKIISLGVEEVGLIRTKEGIHWAAKLINDSHYRIAKALYSNENYTEAKKYLQRYSEYLSKGVDSIYDIDSLENLEKKIRTSIWEQYKKQR